MATSHWKHCFGFHCRCWYRFDNEKWKIQAEFLLIQVKMLPNDILDEAIIKRRKTASPSQVRVLYILKKRKDSRRPFSWRKPVVTQTLEELRVLLEKWKEEEGNPSKLQATLEALARTESDCSSVKHGVDSGIFGKGGKWKFMRYTKRRSASLPHARHSLKQSVASLVSLLLIDSQCNLCHRKAPILTIINENRKQLQNMNTTISVWEQWQ